MGSPNVIALSPITNLQTKQGVKIQCTDANGNPDQLAKPPSIAVDQSGSLAVANLQPVAGATPPNSAYTFDLIGGPNPSNGPVNISLQALNSSGQLVFVGKCTEQVNLDPSIPGAPAEFVVTDGGVVVTSSGNAVSPAPTTAAGQTP